MVRVTLFLSIVLWKSVMAALTSRKTCTILPYLQKLNSEYDIVLASASPRRKELLALMGISNFRIVVSTFAEDLDKMKFSCSADYCRATAEKKLESVMQIVGMQKKVISKPCLLISADTVVEVNGNTLEKPQDKEHSAQMIRSLSGYANLYPVVI